jgi:hypothetical protein
LSQSSAALGIPRKESRSGAVGIIPPSNRAGSAGAPVGPPPRSLPYRLHRPPFHPSRRRPVPAPAGTKPLPLEGKGAGRTPRRPAGKRPPHDVTKAMSLIIIVGCASAHHLPPIIRAGRGSPRHTLSQSGPATTPNAATAGPATPAPGPDSPAERSSMPPPPLSPPAPARAPPASAGTAASPARHC